MIFLTGSSHSSSVPRWLETGLPFFGGVGGYRWLRLADAGKTVVSVSEQTVTSPTTKFTSDVSVKMTKLTALKQDIEQFGISFRQGEWESLVQRLSVLSVSRGEIIEKQVHVARQWFFIDDGIAASEQTWTHGGTTIVRFFERGDFCANMTSVWTQDIAADELFAITDVSCIVVPNEVFTDAYLNGGSFGLYLRHKVMAAHLYAKELTSAKTAGDTETRYQFLESLHPEVVARAPQKEVARFLGLTPQSLSRFLRRRKLG